MNYFTQLMIICMYHIFPPASTVPAMYTASISADKTSLVLLNLLYNVFIIINLLSKRTNLTYSISYSICYCKQHTVMI